MLAVAASWKIEQSVRGYLALILLLETGVIGAFLALDFLLFFFAYELMLIPMYVLVGLWGGPTVINNAETLASVPHIILGGGEWFANIGTPKNGGPRLFCLAGNLNKPGVYELPMGYNLKKMIYDVGGGIPNGR